MNQLQTQSHSARSQSMMPTLQELEQLTNICRTLASTPFYSKLGPGGILAIWLTARELRLPPMMCLNGGLHNVEGKVTMSAGMMNMMIVNAGHEANVLRLDERGCRIRFIRSDRKGASAAFEFEFNEKDAMTAGYFGRPGPNGSWDKKPKENWISYPKAMYFSRALSGGARIHMPDVLMNCYVFGELEDATAEQLIGNRQGYSVDEVTQEPQIANEVPMQIEYVKMEGFEEFVKKHSLEINGDELTPQYIFMKESCEKNSKNEVQMINAFMKHEKTFEDRFKAWNSKNNPKEPEEKVG